MNMAPSVHTAPRTSLSWPWSVSAVKTVELVPSTTCGQPDRGVPEGRVPVGHGEVERGRAAGGVLLAPLRVAPAHDVIPSCAPDRAPVRRPDHVQVPMVVARALEGAQLRTEDRRVDAKPIGIPLLSDGPSMPMVKL